MKITRFDDKPLLEAAGDDDLKICFLGVGSAFAQSNHQTNLFIMQGNTYILVDFGMTGPTALAKLGLQPTDIECILPTHSHADHVGGIECLALMNRYVGIPFMKKPKLKMIITEEYQRILWDYTLRGGLEWNERDDETGRKLDFTDFFDVVRPSWFAHKPREIWEVDYGPIHLEIFRTKHIPEASSDWETSFVSYGLLINDRVLISGDTRLDMDLLNHYSDRVETIFHDVQFFPGAVHAPLEDIKEHVSEKDKAKMLLIHYADNYNEQDISGFQGFAEQGIIYSWA